MFRLGRWSEDKVRPLLVAFKKYEDKEHIMTNIRNIKNTDGRFKGIGISNDLPPKEREEIKRLLTDARQEHIASDPEEVENFRFIVVGQGARRRVIKVRKTN